MRAPGEQDPTSEPAQPRLAYVYHPRSFGSLDVAAAARSTCDPIWVVDTEIAETAEMTRLLRRLGPVVDVGGMSHDEAAEAIRVWEPDGILSLKDSQLRWTAEVAQRLDLPFHSLEVARRFTDKRLQRTVLRDAGIPVPRWWNVPSADDEPGWARLEQEAPFPAVIKPRADSEGSRDTARVDSIAQARARAAEAAADDLLLEEYLTDRTPTGVRGAFADYVSVETIVSHGVVSHLAVTGRFPPAPPFRESGFFIDAELSDEDRRAALMTATAAVAGLGVEIGCLHTEIKFTPDGPRVIELNGRIGGGVPEMLHDSTGVALLPVAMRIALGEQVAFDSLLSTRGVAYLFYVHAPAEMRRVTSVDGLEALAEMTDVHEIMLNRGNGQAVDWHEGNHGHVFSVRGLVADHDALEAMERLVHTTVAILGD